MVLGVDYSYGRPSPAALKASAYAFVMRYLSGGTAGKDLTAAEQAALLAAGLSIGVVWETDGKTGPLNGTAGGTSDATRAVAQARALGIPAGVCLYFAVDFQAALGAQLALVRAYGQGVTSICHAAGYRSGIYGGLGTEEEDQGVVDCLWQTYAWSNGQWDPAAVLRQIQNGAIFAGASVDIDQAMAADFGQWPRPDPPPDPPEDDDMAVTHVGIAAGHWGTAGAEAQFLIDLGPFGLFKTPIATPADVGEFNQLGYPDVALSVAQVDSLPTAAQVLASFTPAAAATAAEVAQVDADVRAIPTAVGALSTPEAAQLTDIQTRVDHDLQ